MNKILTKLLLGFFFIILVGIVPPTLYLNKSALEQTTVEIANKLESHIHSFLLYISSTNENLNKAVKQYAEEADIRITLIDQKGVVVAESDLTPEKIELMENHLFRPEVVMAQKSGLGVAQRKSSTLNIEFIYVALRVENQDGFQFVRVAQSLEKVNAQAKSFRKNIYLTMTVIVILLGGVLFLLKRVFSDPIEELTRVAKEIGKGNLDSRVKVRSNDEIGQLAVIMNQMADTLHNDFKQIKLMQKVRTEFLGNVTHELKTPISMISGYLETLLDGALYDEEVNKKFLKKSLKNAKRLEALVTDLVDISRIESGELKMNFHKFNIYTLLESILENAKLQHNTSLEMQLITPDKDLYVYGDEDRLEQVFENLVSNAIRYTDKGSVKILVERGKNALTFKVADTGFGIHREALYRIFERFYRTDKARDRIKGGTGLGLSITKHIVEAHGSTVHVESEEGKGSVFSFTLKLDSIV